MYDTQLSPKKKGTEECTSVESHVNRRHIAVESHKHALQELQNHFPPPFQLLPSLTLRKLYMQQWK